MFSGGGAFGSAGVAGFCPSSAFFSDLVVVPNQNLPSWMHQDGCIEPAAIANIPSLEVSSTCSFTSPYACSLNLILKPSLSACWAGAASFSVATTVSHTGATLKD